MRYLLVLLLATGCTSYSISGGAVRSDGSVGVSGIKSGYEGAAIDLGASRALGDGTSELGAFVTADMAGYVDDGDADGIRWFGASVRYRRYFATTGSLSPYFALGGGAGLGGTYGRNSPVVEGYAELGARVSLGSSFALSLGLRERPAAFIGDGDPAVEPHNTLQLALGLEFRPSGHARKRSSVDGGLARR